MESTTRTAKSNRPNLSPLETVQEDFHEAASRVYPHSKMKTIFKWTLKYGSMKAVQTVLLNL